MPRNLLLFLASLTASVLAFGTAASAADYPVGPDTGYAVGVEQQAVVEEDDSLIDVNIDLGLFDDDDEEEVAMRVEEEPAAPFFPQ